MAAKRDNLKRRWMISIEIVSYFHSLLVGMVVKLMS